MQIPHTDIAVRRFSSGVKPLRVWRWHDNIWGTDGKVLFTSWSRMKEAITAANRLGLVSRAKLREYEKCYYANADRQRKQSTIRYLASNTLSELRAALRLKRKEGKA
jgi:hypothetical protein